MKFLTHRVSAESGGFSQKHFPITFGGHFEFLRKMQRHVHFGNEAR